MRMKSTSEILEILRLFKKQNAVKNEQGIKAKGV